MALSLQMKKFVISEHIGNYANIQLPGFPDKEGNAQPEDVRIHYMEAGTGEPLILIHSIGQSMHTWREVFYNLSEHYRVIAIDLLGHGFSARPVQFDYTIQEHADTIKLFMDALGIESAHFAAFSVGALYTLYFAVNNADRVGKIVTISPGGITKEMPLSIRLMDSVLLGGFACRLYSRRTVEKLLSECFFDLTNIDNDLIENYYLTVADTFSRKAIQLCIANLDEGELEKCLRNIENEVLILWGTEDKWHLPETSELYHAALTNAHFSVIRNVGHFLHEEKPARFLECILEYIPALVDGEGDKDI